MSSSPPSSWHQLWEEAQPRLRSIQEALSSQNTPSARVIRVGQLDAELLDQELVQLLQEPVGKALNLIRSAFTSQYQPELTLLIQLILYKFSVWNSGASYGARLQGLKYASSDATTRSGLPLRTLLIHGTLTTLVPYIHTRIRAHALSNAWPEAPSHDRRRRAWEFLTKLESSHGLLALVNFIAFLWNGRYRTLSDRILGLRLVPLQRLTKREVSYEFMNRQMVWHAFTEFLLFFLPLINTRAPRRRLSRLAANFTLASILPPPIRSTLGLSKSSSDEKQRVRKGKYWSLPLDQCAICYEDAATLNLADPSNTLSTLAAPTYSSTSADPPTESTNAVEEPPLHPVNTPYVTSCGHAYCYVCVTTRMVRTADDRTGVGPGGTRWECLRCGEGVVEADRVEIGIEDSDSEFGSSFSMGGADFEEGYMDEYDSSNMTFTDMSGSMISSYNEASD
ncbi:unnamed protein product [Somion occarium]|uniref:RING-type E3 ubiquitin transferase (cysteine targeting) n=1 Tax=Somion occarium TaxID=3059160 RepID=A0ABP1D0F7_9APHY